jgi:hypothetical protein
VEAQLLLLKRTRLTKPHELRLVHHGQQTIAVKQLVQCKQQLELMQEDLVNDKKQQYD